MKKISAFLLVLQFAQTTQLSATSIIPFKNLGETAQYSDAVVLADAVERFESTSGSSVFYDCLFQVKNRSKGILAPGETFTLRRQSHRLGSWNADIAGDFVPEEGKTYLLFLRRSGEAWKLMAMSYYVFEVKKIGGGEFLVPIEESLSFAVAPRPDGVQPEPLGVYHIANLLQILGQYADGTAQAWDATAALTGLSPDDFPQERALPTGCDFDLGSGLCRWEDAAVNVYYDDTGTPTDFDATLNVILGTMTSSYTGIAPINSGSASYTPTCAGGAQGGNFVTFVDGLNGRQTTLIIFDDPCSQITDLVGCVGILAIGGSYSFSTTHTYKGDTWKDAAYGFVIVNNGAPDCLTSTDYEIMLTHELTHTYRMDHLDPGDFPGQNMNPLCCNPINVKDIECMNYTYDLAAPVKLSAFDVQPHLGRHARIIWATASESNNDFFTVERSADGLRFEKVKDIAGNNSFSLRNYEWIDPLPYPGLSYYRLSQTDFDGRTSNLGIKPVRIGEGDVSVSVFPNPVSGATLTVLTDFPGASDGFLEITDTNGKVAAAQQLTLGHGRNQTHQPVQHLPPGIYWLRLQTADDVRVLKFLKN